MSVKSKVKRCNKEISKLQKALETERLSNRRLRQRLDEEKQSNNYTKLLENIVKFAVTNHMGNLRCGMSIDRYGIDKMEDLRLNIEYQPFFNDYAIKVNW